MSDVLDQTRNSESNIIYQLSVIQKRIQRVLDAEIKHSIDSRLSVSHGDMLFYLLLNKRASISEIKNYLCVTKSTMTILVKKLEELDLVKRIQDASDSRKTFLELTDKAKSLVDRSLTIGAQTRKQLLANLTKREIQTLIKILGKMKLNTEGW